MSDAPRWDALLPSLLTRLRERRITGMYGNNDPQDWSIRLAEGIDPLCVEAAETIARLRADVAQAQAALREAREAWKALDGMDDWDDTYGPLIERMDKALAAERKRK